ncbi:MAG: M20/M25/M40 family metallo-hydrolase [Armatimonadetes bacterium]|nr:M20/M25/M40 family metallo-hydrolase [Armatimonadota bacterium]
MSTTTTPLQYVERLWDDSIVPTLVDYIKIPNKSQDFDPQWREHGHMDRAVALIEGWCKENAVPGMTVEVVRLDNRGPVILMEVPARGSKDASSGTSDDTVLLYGHLDKQPEMHGWNEGLGPWTPVQRDDRLYGRGGADDGYAAFASLGAIKTLHERGKAHARCVILIESGEESGSPDLPAYIEALADRIGKPSLVVCLDSGCGDYERMWCTTSLRGMVNGTLNVQVLLEGVHSGDASGIVPSSFRIARTLLSRLEEEKSGRILLDALQSDIPAQRKEQAAAVAGVLDTAVYDKFPFAGGTKKPMHDNLTELVLNRTWRPTLSVTGAAGLPALENAGNVLRPYTSLKLSLRLPPNCPSESAVAAVKVALEKDPPYGANVTFEGDGADGWNAPPLADWLGASVARASRTYFGNDAVYMGEGGSIPFMAMLGRKFPEAQFLITGVLGPGSNAHGPNEFLHIPTGKKLTACVADVLADHAERKR